MGSPCRTFSGPWVHRFGPWISESLRKNIPQTDLAEIFSDNSAPAGIFIPERQKRSKEIYLQWPVLHVRTGCAGRDDTARPRWDGDGGWGRGPMARRCVSPRDGLEVPLTTLSQHTTDWSGHHQTLSTRCCVPGLSHWAWLASLTYLLPGKTPWRESTGRDDDASDRAAGHISTALALCHRVPQCFTRISWLPLTTLQAWACCPILQMCKQRLRGAKQLVPAGTQVTQLANGERSNPGASSLKYLTVP